MTTAACLPIFHRFVCSARRVILQNDSFVMCPTRTRGQVCPWKDHLYDVEREGGFAGEVLFCVFQDDRDKSYRVQVETE